MVARLLSVNVGLPKDIDWHGKSVHTGIWKEPVQGRRTVRRLNIDGDGQGDLAGHGGEHRAVMVYQTDSYRYWERYLNRTFPTYGQFGENLTVDGLADDVVCIGDRYAIGTALFEVTQPRVTCYRLGIRMDEPLMASLVVSHHRPGFYMRVLQEGDVAAGDEIVKVSAGPEQMTVAEIGCPLVSARAFARATGAGSDDSCIAGRLASLVQGSSRTAGGRKTADRQCRPHARFRSSCMARIPSSAGFRHPSGMQKRLLIVSYFGGRQAARRRRFRDSLRF